MLSHPSPSSSRRLSQCTYDSVTPSSSFPKITHCGHFTSPCKTNQVTNPQPQSRDILIARGTYPFALKPNVVPGSDGAGTVLSTGKNVTRFHPGDHVVTIINQTHLAGRITASTASSGLGGTIDGTFRQYGVFDEQGLVRMPRGLSFIEAAALSCAGLTAWNALFPEGRLGRGVRSGDWVVAQGTGGVSCFVVQFAKMVGARVIATTGGSKEKRALLERLGVDHVVDYHETKDWGVAAKELTGGVGVDFVVDVVGGSTLGQSVNALALDGVVCVVGFAGGEGSGEVIVPSVLDCWVRLFTARGVWVGSRMQMEEMCRAIEGNPGRVRPVVDGRVFKLEELKEAYEYLATGKHLGKVCISIQDS